jgi:hypothetical protein
MGQLRRLYKISGKKYTLKNFNNATIAWGTVAKDKKPGVREISYRFSFLPLPDNIQIREFGLQLAAHDHFRDL